MGSGRGLDDVAVAHCWRLILSGQANDEKVYSGDTSLLWRFNIGAQYELSHDDRITIVGCRVRRTFVVWSSYRADSYVRPNNNWFKSLSLLPDKINMVVRAFLVFEAMFLVGDLMWLASHPLRRAYLYTLNALGLQGIQVVIG